MGRPTKHTPDDVARMVVDAAEALARQDGVARHQPRKIAAEVGYAPGSLYNVIGDLDDIILHLNARRWSACRSTSRPASTRAGPRSRTRSRWRTDTSIS
jgi:AcrR family transcriptional regulator